MAEGPRPLQPFALERFFAKHEFAAEHLLCCSDRCGTVLPQRRLRMFPATPHECSACPSCNPYIDRSEPLAMGELLALADADVQARWARLRLAYTETQGLPALRQAIAAAHYTGVAPDQLVVAAPQEALYLTMRALLAPGDRVVCCFPGYQSLYEVARAIGCTVDLWHLRSAPGGGLSFDLAEAERLITPGTRLVVVNSPHNPSGAHFSHSEWARLVELCRAAGAHLFRCAVLACAPTQLNGVGARGSPRSRPMISNVPAPLLQRRNVPLPRAGPGCPAARSRRRV